jgi:hypothetical protein
MAKETLTLAEVIKYFSEKKIVIEFFGTKKSTMNVFNGFSKKIALSIAREQGLTTLEATRLPFYTRLGEKSKKKFSKFQDWCKKNGLID